MTHKSPFEPTGDFGTVTKAQARLCKCADSSDILMYKNSDPFNESEIKTEKIISITIHLHRLAGFVTVPNSHALAQMAMCVLFM